MTLRAAVAAGLVGVLLVLVQVVYSAAITVPSSALGAAARPVTADAVKPVACAGVGLAAYVHGSGTVAGGAGAELVTGSAGGDEIDAGGGGDCVVGGAGDDVIDGGAGTDVCLGGPGDDVFVGCETQIDQ